jgi:hypothetical protein
MLVKLPSWRCRTIKMIGDEPIKGVEYEKKGRKKPLPVYPSDHFGLVLRLTPGGKE